MTQTLLVDCKRLPCPTSQGNEPAGFEQYLVQPSWTSMLYSTHENQ